MRTHKPKGATVQCDFEAGYTADHAFVKEPDTFTGLYDHNGAPLHRPQQPMGFDPHRWDQSPRKVKR